VSGVVSQTPSPLDWLQPLILMIVVGLLLLLVLRQTMELSRARGELMKVRRVYTVTACGDKIEVRPFKEGDYVGLILGDCGDGKQARVIGIYVEETRERA